MARSAATLLSISFAFSTVSQEPSSLLNGAVPFSQSDEDFVDIVIPLKNANAYYCRSEDVIQWTREFMEQATTKLLPLMGGSDGEMEFRREGHSVKLRIPRKNIDAVRQFWSEEEKTKPDASEEERKRGVTTICS